MQAAKLSACGLYTAKTTPCRRYKALCRIAWAFIATLIWNMFRCTDICVATAGCIAFCIVMWRVAGDVELVPVR
jgi:hypothetical protein